MNLRRYVFMIIVILTVLINMLVGCTSLQEYSDDEVREINVFAAASLTECLTEAKQIFEMDESGLKINLNLAGSQTLKTSVENGGKADMLISANVGYMNELKEKGFIGEHAVLVRNRITLIRNVNCSYDITAFRDLSSSGIKIAAGDESVPVGQYWKIALNQAQQDGLITVAERLAIENHVVTKELNVKDVLSKVLLNEVDCGVVYRTDVTEANQTKIVVMDLPIFNNIEAIYPMAVLKESENRQEVNKFYQFLLSEDGKNLFQKVGFITD